MGIAAVGFAFGHPQHSIAATAISHKRKTPSRAALDNVQPPLNMPATPSQESQAASAPTTSRLRKRSSGSQPFTSSINSRGGIRTLDSTPETKLGTGVKDEGEGQSSPRDSGPSTGEGPFAFEFKGSENSPPTWLRHMSTLSSLKTGSPTTTPRADSPSVSYSNGSTAPILPSSKEPGSATVSRNKLVKRSASQRALHGSSALHSTLRRPATSHQRSATLQQQSQDEEFTRPYSTIFATLPNDLQEENQSYDEASQRWEPFFKPQGTGSARDRSLRKRNSSGIINRNDSPKNLVPGIKELPTLLLASSISSGSSHEAITRRASNLSGRSRPFTPIGHDDFGSPSTDRIHAITQTDPELNSRRSFSIGDMFPSPSPSTWRMPRSGSLRRTRPLSSNIVGRRIVSAPLSFDPPENNLLQELDSHGNGDSDPYNEQNQTSTFGALPKSTDPRPVSSSTLPPISRLSPLEIDLPETIPSYPGSPQSEHALSPQERSMLSSPPASSPLGAPIVKVKPQRFSSAPSDRGSTLLGSDNDNSRLMSGDEDDIDARSETIYDSTRTGATGSSHSGIRRPPIDTIFDESPPPDLPHKSKVVALQDLLHNDIFVEHDPPQHISDDRKASTAAETTTSRKGNDELAPAHGTNELPLSSEASSSPPPGVEKFERPAPDLDEETNDDLWAFDNPADSDEARTNPASTSNGQYSPRLDLLAQRNETHRRRESPPSSALDRSAKPNPFEWSEQPVGDKDSSKGDSPRPKTVHGRQVKELRGSRVSGRRGPSALHLRSQSVPVSREMSGHRGHNHASKLDTWVLGNKGPSEDWDDDFQFDELPQASKDVTVGNEPMRASYSSAMLVPRSILERQASVHGQFGQVKELTLLVEELKRLQVQASAQGIMEGQSAELWKEAEGIINLATLDDEEQDLFPPRSPHSPSFDFDAFDEDSPSARTRRRSGLSPPRDDHPSNANDSSGSQPSSRPSQELSGLETPPRPSSRPRKESSAKAKHVLESIHQQRNHYDSTLLDAPFAQKKLPFDTTSLKDLVTRAGVVTRALKEIVRRAENGPETPEVRPSTPRDPPYISQMFQQPPISPTVSKSPRVTQGPTSPKSPKSQKSSPYLGGSIAGNDNNDINGHMKLMTVV